MTINPYSTGPALSMKNCLGDFFTRIPDAVSIIADFVGAPESTVRSWKSDRTPGGERHIQTLIFLEFVGYNVAELRDIDQVIYRAAAYITLGTVGIEEMAKKIGASDPKRIFEYIRGNNGISAERALILCNLLDEHLPDFEKQKAVALAKVAHVRKASKENLNAEELIEKFTTACEEVRSLGKKLLDGSRDVRFDMRERIGKGGHGKEPLLHTTWETLYKLLAERGEIKQ